ncbi:putative NAD-dependent epimerase/dehydratase [Stachybotrys elegans]|uniref:NAD-dependent epimerase/dehydratase n=1 Tax=Stachybotrys elegans TaxID=80388 RepID=A0A8K0SDH8_9HYPO|nr:putative NAD-dependent epimerase/dehydratase [Stachybotrys elegans]
MAVSTTYAVLGATGNCGKGLIQNLLKSPGNKINAYCRNKQKLYQQLPEVIENKQVQVFEGSILDPSLMEDCIRDTKAVFLVVTSNDNIPGCRLSQDLSATVIEALQSIRTQTPDAKMPKLVLLSSSTIDDYLARKMPGWFRPVMLRAASNVYEDLRVAEKFLRSQSDWVSTIYIKPGGLSVDISRGHQLTLHEEESFISYLDLSAAMIEAADDGEGRYDEKNVGVVNGKRGVGAKFPRGTPLCITVGLLRHYFPWLHSYLPSTGPS